MNNYLLLSISLKNLLNCTTVLKYFSAYQRATRRDVDRVKGSRPPSPMNYEPHYADRDDDVEEEAFDISDISDDSDEIAVSIKVLPS